jgi:hypothetical protein
MYEFNLFARHKNTGICKRKNLKAIFHSEDSVEASISV